MPERWRLPDPGELDDQVAIEAVIGCTHSALGEDVPTWGLMPGVPQPIPAKVVELSGRELWQAQQTRAQETHEVIIRYCEGLSSLLNRFRWGNRQLNIQSVINPDGRRIWHLCKCTEEFVAAPQRGY